MEDLGSGSGIRFKVNGNFHTVEVDPSTPLLYILRNHISLNGPKYGCGLGQCGACAIHLDGQVVFSCLLPAVAVQGREIRTLKGLIADDGTLHPVQQAFIDEQAAQCGYCTNGMIMSAVSLLNRNSAPGDEEIRQALQVNLCRCGTQSRVIRAIKRASGK